MLWTRVSFQKEFAFLAPTWPDKSQQAHKKAFRKRVLAIMSRRCCHLQRGLISSAPHGMQMLKLEEPYRHLDNTTILSLDTVYLRKKWYDAVSQTHSYNIFSKWDLNDVSLTSPLAASNLQNAVWLRDRILIRIPKSAGFVEVILILLSTVRCCTYRCWWYRYLQQIL